MYVPKDMHMAESINRNPFRQCGHTSKAFLIDMRSRSASLAEQSLHVIQVPTVNVIAKHTPKNVVGPVM